VYRRVETDGADDSDGPRLVTGRGRGALQVEIYMRLWHPYEGGGRVIAVNRRRRGGD
jgi:hypothetical protein